MSAPFWQKTFWKPNLTYRSVPVHMPCGPPFFPARNDGATQAAHNGILALALCAQWCWHEFLSPLPLLFIGGSQQRTEVQEHSRCVTDSPHFSTQCKESCAMAAVYAVHNDGHRSISRLSARSTATRADRCLSARPRNGSPSTSGRGWTRWNWRRGWFSLPAISSTPIVIATAICAPACGICN